MENRTEFRNHPIIMLKGIGGVIAFILIIGMRNIKELMDIKLNQDTFAEISKHTTSILIGFLALIGICALVVIAQYFKWKNTKIFLDTEHIYYEYTGFFKRINKQVSFNNVSSVNTKVTIFDKIFNVCEIQLDINSAETASQADYKIILSTRKTEQFKQMVDTAKNEAVTKKAMTQKQVLSDVSVDTTEDATEYVFSTGQCLRHVLLNVSLLTIVWFLGVMIFSFISAFKLDNWIGAITGLVIGAGPAIVDFGQSIARFMNFKTARKGNSIYLNYGFLSTQNYIIPVKNIVSIGITQSFSAKIAGYECIEVNTIGIGNEKNELSVLSIYMKKEDARMFADKIIPEFRLVHDFVMQPRKVYIYKSIVYVI
ncbi:MAG: PH domain-containing protein, partial [Lachnospiraceae bacterium]|nr:PH domain-containing protein [Lachnospiraceae bacterium]